MSQIHGGEMIASMLAAEGVDTVFGIIDGTYFGLYSNLQKHGIRLITPRHETSAAHMAGAYSRLTGKLGVCIASNGPGVANILPGVAVENGEGHRVLLITSCRREGIIYPDRGGTFQYFNQVGVIRPMAKWSGVAQTRERVPELLRRALRIAWRGRPGVVHLDVPESIINGKDKFDPATVREPVRYRRVTPIEPSDEVVATAAEWLTSAKSPMIHVGTGIIHAGAEAELAEVAELLQAPVTTSWGARGAVTDDHPCCISMVHLKLNQKVRNDADLVLAIGTRFGETDWWGKPPYWAPPDRQRTIQVDNDEENIGLNKPIDLGILADARRFLSALAARLREHGPAPAARAEALARYARLRDQSRAELDKKLKPTSRGVNPAFVPRTCQEVLPDDTIWVYDGGNTVVWSNFFQRVTATNSVVSTFKFGMLGAGVSQAIGAKAACPDRTVCCLIGDGAMGFHLQEIETAVRNGLDVIYVVFCDRQWGMVKMNQQFALRPIKTMIRKSLDPEETINADLGEIAFDKVAEAMGASGERVSRAEDLAAAVRRAAGAGTTAVIHVDIDPVAHMWAPGLVAFKDMHLEPAGK